MRCKGGGAWRPRTKRGDWLSHPQNGRGPRTAHQPTCQHALPVRSVPDMRKHQREPVAHQERHSCACMLQRSRIARFPLEWFEAGPAISNVQTWKRDNCAHSCEGQVEISLFGYISKHDKVVGGGDTASLDAM